MRLVDDWRRVVSRSLSFWLLIFGILAMVLPEVRYGLTGQDYDPFLAWWTGILLLVAAAGGRLIRQGLRWWQEAIRILGFIIVVIALAFLFAAEVRAAPASETDTLDIAVPFIAKEEGERLVAYRDSVGIPTIGFGHTDGVRMNMTISHQQALEMLGSDVAAHRAGLHRYFTPLTINSRLPPTRDAAYTSTAFNCGVAAIGKSTATRRLNAGNVAGGCEALTWWNRAGNRVLRGLFERRKREQALCMQGL